MTAEKSAQVMGTSVRVKVKGWGAHSAADQAINETMRLDRVFSRYNKDSEISRLNRREKFKPSPDTKKVFTLADRIKRLSKGAFNVSLSGKYDLGGIGKGYAVEVARGCLPKRGVKSAIIDMHSSIAVIGDNWRIGILDPRTTNSELRTEGKLLETIVLNDGDALATSGQYEQPGHIIDPRTGKPADKCLSVTIICKDAGLADALSTAVFVLGPVEGMKLAKKLGVRALIIDRNGITYDNSGSKLR